MSLFKVHMESCNDSRPGMPKWYYRQKRDWAWKTALSVPVRRLKFYYRRLSHQPCNRVEAPDWCFILLPGQGPLPISSQTLGCFSRHHLSMGRQEHRDTRRTCCFSSSKGTQNRPDVAFPAFKKNKRWIIKALDRNTRRTVAWLVGGRDAATVRRLYGQLEHLNDSLFYTDDWDALAKVLPLERRIIGKNIP